MRIASVRKMDISNGIGIGVSLFTQGCRLRCKGCHNHSIWSFDGGEEYTQEIEDAIIKLLKPDYITRFSVLGGEPFEQENVDKLLDLLRRVKEEFPDKNIWLYTGYLFETTPWYCEEMFNYIDVLVDGPYIESQRDVTLPFRGSGNQRLIDMKKTLASSSVVELEL